MNRLVSLALVLPLLLPVLAHAQSAVDERAIIAATHALDAAIDAKDWEGARGLLLDEVSLSLPGGEASTVPAETLVERWRATLHESKTSFHLRGGERVTFDGADSAVLHSKAQLWQHLPGAAGDDRYERWADYHHELDRGEDGVWRVRHYGYVTRLESGNIAVRDHRLPAPSATDEAEAPEEEPATAEGVDAAADEGTDTGSAAADEVADEGGAEEDGAAPDGGEGDGTDDEGASAGTTPTDGD